MHKILLGILFIAPSVVFAAGVQNLGDVINLIGSLVNDFLIPFLISLALIAFFWRNVVSLFKKDELVNKAESKWYLFWGVIALFVMLSVWGLVGILADAFDIKSGIPQLGIGSESNTDPVGNDFGPLPPCPSPSPCKEY